MNLKYLTIFLLILFSTNCKSQTDNKEDENFKKTELYIIGTIHNPTDIINSDTLFNILKKIKPDLILVELDSSFFTKDFNFDTIKYPDLLSTNENISINKYKQFYKTDVRPFDITGRNDFYRKYNFFTTQSKMYSAISKLYDNGKLDSSCAADFELISFTLDLTNKVKYRSLSELNSDVSIKLTKIRQKILYDKTISIVKRTKSLNNWIDFAELQKKFWVRRNNKMAANIEYFASEKSYKKIVVFTGVNHLYFILELLKEKQNKNYVIKDFWGK